LTLETSRGISFYIFVSMSKTSLENYYINSMIVSVGGIDIDFVIIVDSTVIKDDSDESDISFIVIMITDGLDNISSRKIYSPV
jgi:hypothetical protein